MKKLSEYKGAEAIELWADLLDPFVDLITNEKVKKAMGDKKLTPLAKAQTILKSNPKAAVKVLTTIDPEPVDGVNAVLRILDVLLELLNNADMASFFGFAVQGQKAKDASGNATEATQENEN